MYNKLPVDHAMPIMQMCHLILDQSFVLSLSAGNVYLSLATLALINALGSPAAV